MEVRSTTVPPPIEGGRFTQSRLWLSLFVAAFILGFFIFLQPSPITNIDSGFKWLGAKNYSERGTLALQFPDSLTVNPFEFPPVPIPFLYPVAGAIYPVFPALPMVWNGYIFRWLGDGFWWLSTWIAATLLFGLLVWYTKPYQFDPFHLLLAFLFATPLAVYGSIYWEHALAALVGCGGIVFLRSSRHVVSFVGGLLLGLAPWIRPEMVAWSILALVASWVFLANRQRVLGTTGFLVGMLVGVSMQYELTGTLLPLQVISNYENGDTVFSAGGNVRFPIHVYVELLIGAGNWWISGIATLMVALGVIGWRYGKWFAFLLPSMTLLFLVTRIFDPLPVFHTIQANGLLYTLPILLLAPWGIRRLPHHYIWIAATVGLLIAILALGKVAQGVHWGMRFFLPAAFPITIAALQALREKPLSKQAIWLGSFAVIAVTIYGVFWHAGIAKRQIEFAKTVSSNPALIATDISWVGGDLAPLLLQRQIAYVRGREKMGRFLLTLKEQQIFSFQYIRNNNSEPLTQMAPNLEKLIRLRRISTAPTPEKGYDYRIEFYDVTGDSLLFGSLAGELGALRFAGSDSSGLEDVRLALRWNPDDYRPAIALLAFGIENRKGKWIDEALTYFDDHPVPKQFEGMIAEARRYRIYWQ